jgi:hypothetical protein
VQSESKLDRILQIRTLNTSEAYVENILGRPKYTSGETRVYRVDGCNVSITYDAGTVSILGLEGVSQHCDFPLARFFPSYPLGDLRSLTFGQISRAFGENSEYTVAVRCMDYSCGERFPPYVDFYRYGGYSDGFIDVLVSNSSPYRGSGVSSSLSRFRDNAKYVYDRDDTPNSICEEGDEYIKAFSSLLVKNVYVGWKMDGGQGGCG